MPKLIIPGFRIPIILEWDAIPRAHRMAVFVRNHYAATRKNAFECKCHETLFLWSQEDAIIPIYFLSVVILI